MRSGNALWDFQHESHMPGGGETAEMQGVQGWRLVRSLLQGSKQQGGTWTAEGAQWHESGQSGCVSKLLLMGSADPWIQGSWKRGKAKDSSNVSCVCFPWTVGYRAGSFPFMGKAK